MKLNMSQFVVYVLRIVMSHWLIIPLIKIKDFLHLFGLVPKSVSSDNRTVTSVYFLVPFAWNTFFLPFALGDAYI